MIIVLSAPVILSITDFYKLSGTATVTVLNSPPTVNDISIIDAGFRVSQVFLEKEYQYSVNLSDSNTVTDIQNITLKIWLANQTSFDNHKNCDYKFQYHEFNTVDRIINGSFKQVQGEEEVLSIANCTVSANPRNSTGTWNFAITLPETDCSQIFIKAYATDSSGETAEITNGPFSIINILESTEYIEHSSEIPFIEDSDSDTLEKVIILISLIGAIGLFYRKTKKPVEQI